MPGIQRYVSDELTHFVGRNMADDENRYILFMKILTSGLMTNPNVGSHLEIKLTSKVSENEMFNPKVICFCDISIGDLEIHKQKYGPFGISFLKTYLAQKGANPVFYVAKNSILVAPSDSLMYWWSEDRALELSSSSEASLSKVDRRSAYFDQMTAEYHEIFRSLLKTPGPIGFERIRHFQRFLAFNIFSFLKFWDEALREDDPANYYMEREWRIAGNLKFELGDVRRVILPEIYARRFRQDLSEYTGQVTFSS
jgi:hypothetical protein